MPPAIPPIWPATSSPVHVFYLTDRDIDTETKGPVPPREGQHGENWSEASCGQIDVELPLDGDASHLPDAQIGTLVSLVRDCEPPEPEEAGRQNGFKNFVTQIVNASPGHCITLYIQGFNNVFDTAIIRAAQIWSDTRDRCLMLAYSWSSAGQVDRYVSDVEHSSYSVPLLRALLLALARDGAHVDMIAHSMGTRLTMQTLATLRQECQKLHPVHQLILAAPDIGAETDNNDFATLLRLSARCYDRMTIYASVNDSVLAASESIHGGIPRAGRHPRQIRKDLLDLAAKPEAPPYAVDVVDSSTAPGDPLGHGYFASSGEAMRDIAGVLRGVPARSRVFGDGGAPVTLVCEDGQNCDSSDPAPLYRLIVAPDRRYDPGWLGRLVRFLIPLKPAQ